MTHPHHTTHGNPTKGHAMASASHSRHRLDKKGGAGKSPVGIVPSLLAPLAEKAVEAQYDRALLTFCDWMTLASALMLSAKDHTDGAITPSALLIQTVAEDDRKSEALLVFAMGSNGLNLEFDDKIDVLLSEDNFDRCQFQLFKHDLATPGVASLLYEVNVGDSLMDRLGLSK